MIKTNSNNLLIPTLIIKGVRTQAAFYNTRSGGHVNEVPYESCSFIAFYRLSNVNQFSGITQKFVTFFQSKIVYFTKNDKLQSYKIFLC